MVPEHPQPINLFALNDYPGYAIDSEGIVWSCWQWVPTGKGMPCSYILGVNWKPLKPDLSSRDRPRFRLRTLSGEYQKRYATDLLKQAQKMIDLQGPPSPKGARKGDFLDSANDT